MATENPYFANVLCGYKHALQVYDLTLLVEVEPGSYFIKTKQPIDDIPISYKLERGTAHTFFPFINLVPTPPPAIKQKEESSQANKERDN